MLILLVHRVKSNANQLKINTIYNFSIIKYKVSNENTKRVRTILSFDFELVGFQVIGDTAHYFLQVVDKYSCKKTGIVREDHQTLVVRSF